MKTPGVCFPHGQRGVHALFCSVLMYSLKLTFKFYMKDRCPKDECRFNTHTLSSQIKNANLNNWVWIFLLQRGCSQTSAEPSFNFAPLPNPLIVPTQATSLELSSLYNHKQYQELRDWKDSAFIQRITFILLKNITHFISGNYFRK